MVHMVVIRDDEVVQKTKIKDDEVTDYLMAYPGHRIKTDGKPIIGIWVYENTKTIGLVTDESETPNEDSDVKKSLPVGVTAQSLEVSHQEFTTVVSQSSTRFTLAPDKKSTVKMVRNILELFPDDLLVTSIHIEGDLQHITIKCKKVSKGDED